MTYERIKREQLTDVFCSRLIKAINRQTLEDIENPQRLSKKWEKESIKNFEFLKKLNNIKGGLLND
jgi:hypothetical protein